MTERELLDALAADVADLVAHAERITERARPVEAITPRADADDAGARLVAWLVESDAPVLVDLARTVIRQRDEARRALDVSQSTLRDALAREVDATARADAAEKDRDEARREAAHYTDMAMQADVSCQREQARADAAEATVRELRALCEEAAESITPTAYVHTAKLAARLRAAAVQPASEGRADA